MYQIIYQISRYISHTLSVLMLILVSWSVLVTNLLHLASAMGDMILSSLKIVLLPIQIHVLDRRS